MIERVLEMLQQIPIFGGISEPALQHVIERASTYTIKKGEYLFHENDPANSMFVLIEGSVSVTKIIDGRSYELCKLNPGDCIGELELIDLCPRAASIRARENCLTIEITSKILRELHDIDGVSFLLIHMNMGREVSRRLRKLDADMLQVRIQGEDLSN